ncbi:MAG: enoyl-CoA hydratase [Acidimicrobiales bacterium]
MIHLDWPGVTGDKTIASIRLDRPERRNALDTGHCRDLAEALDSATRSGARVVVLSGVGRAFCAGADLATVRDPAFHPALRSVLKAMTQSPAVVMVAAHGPVMGAGVQLCVAADLRVAAPDVEFAIPAAKLGIVVDRWTVRRLSQVAGLSAAQAILLGAQSVGAEEALACGLAQRIGTGEDAFSWAVEIATLAPLALTGHKLALNSEVPPDQEDPGVAAAHARAWASHDLSEAMAARTEKRRARFQGS